MLVVRCLQRQVRRCRRSLQPTGPAPAVDWPPGYRRRAARLRASGPPSLAGNSTGQHPLQKVAMGRRRIFSFAHILGANPSVCIEYQINV